ncbi:MAG: GNAT family N-acetyltransferase [Patescibacteria group bacterium]
MDFRFTNEYPTSQLDEVVAYLLGPRLWIPQTDYPDFGEWAERTYQELLRGGKRAMVATARNKEIVGVTIYQRHRKRADYLEIKNLTVRPDQRGRYLASFLLRNTEIEGSREFGVQAVVCDAKANNVAVRWFLKKHRYHVSGRENLYNLGAGDDLVYAKDLKLSVGATR